MMNEAFCTLNIASLQFDEYPELGLWSKGPPNEEPTMFTKLFLGSMNTPNYVHKINVRPVKNGL